MWLVEGGPQVGKTTLLAAAGAQLARRRWRCGWARRGRAVDAVRAAARYRRRTLLLVDDAETWGDLAELVRVLANGGRPLPVRVIVAARSFDDWWSDVLGRLDPGERQRLAAGRTVVGDAAAQGQPASLASGLTGDAAAGDVRAGTEAVRDAAAGDGADLADSAGSSGPAPVADRSSAAVLLRLAALIVALPTRVGELGPAEVRTAVWGVLNGKGYWRRVAAEVSPPGEPAPALRAALACAAAVGQAGLADAAAVLRRMPALATGAGDRLARLVLRWRALTAGSAGSASGGWPGEPAGPVGAEPSADSWTAAALAAERHGTGRLARLTLSTHRTIWTTGGSAVGDPAPATEALVGTAAEALVGTAAVAPVDEALAWLAGELDLRREDLRWLGEAIAQPAWSLRRTAVTLARRLLPYADTEEERAELWLGLGVRLAELGRWEEARQAAEEAMTGLRALAAFDPEHPDRYATDLAVAERTWHACSAALPAPLGGGEPNLV